MPITLTKLFSPTAEVSFPFLGETVHVTWAPFKYTGEMQELFEEMVSDAASGRTEIAGLKAEAEAALAEAAALTVAGDISAAVELRATAAAKRDEADRLELGTDSRYRHSLRDVLAKLIVTWDVLDETKKPIPTDVATLATLPPRFLETVFFSLSAENQPDPTKALPSDEPSPTEGTSAPSRTGTTTSSLRELSASPRSSSTNGRSGHGTTRRGATGRRRSKS